MTIDIESDKMLNRTIVLWKNNLVVAVFYVNDVDIKIHKI
jgi:hypothetical protein